MAKDGSLREPRMLLLGWGSARSNSRLFDWLSGEGYLDGHACGDTNPDYGSLLHHLENGLGQTGTNLNPKF